MSIIVAVRKHGKIVIDSDSAQTEDGMIVSAAYYANNSAVMAACTLDDSCAEPIYMHSITID
jgi:hypothetical protein